MLWVLSGRVALVRHLPEGEDSVIAILGPGEHFGDECLADQPPRFDARSEEEVRLLSLDGEALRDVASATEENREAMERTFELARFLDGISELAGLSPSARLDLAFHVQQHQTEAGQAVIREGETSDSMYLIRFGGCRVTRRGEGGQEQHVADIGAGQAFGEIGLLFSEPRTATVTCSEPCVLIEIPKAALEHAMRQSFHVGLALEQLASARMSEATS